MKHKRLFIFTILYLMSAAARAEVINIPPSVEAGRIAKELNEYQQPSEPGIAAKHYTPLEVPKGAEKFHFALKKVEIQGVYAYPQHYFDGLYTNMLGKNITLADVYILADAIRRVYHEDGYVLTEVFLPEQQIADGTVRIHVTEGYISRLRWNGDLPDSGLLADMEGEIVDTRPFNSKVLESVMLRLNELPGISAQAALEPLPQGAPEGAVGLTITVERKRVSASVSIDDYASRYLGVWETTDKVDGYGLLTPLDHVNVTASGSDPSRLSYEALQYSLPVNASGTTVSAGSNWSFTHPTFRLGPDEIFSYAENVTAGISQPLLRSREESLDVGGQFGVSNQQTNVVKERFTVDRIRTVTASATYNRSDNLGGANLLDVDIVHGLNIFNATQPGSPLLSRPNGRSDFTKLVFNASRLQALPDDLSAMVAVTGQQSSVSLLSSQQFGFGGPNFGRAYDESELTADNGVAGSIELRWQALDGVWSLQPYTFYDIGVLENKEAFAQSFSAADAGFGARAQWKTMHMDFNLAWPLTYTPGVAKLGEIKRDPRINLSVGMIF